MKGIMANMDSKTLAIINLINGNNPDLDLESSEETSDVSNNTQKVLRVTKISSDDNNIVLHTKLCNRLEILFTSKPDCVMIQTRLTDNLSGLVDVYYNKMDTTCKYLMENKGFEGIVLPLNETDIGYAFAILDEDYEYITDKKFQDRIVQAILEIVKAEKIISRVRSKLIITRLAIKHEVERVLNSSMSLGDISIADDNTADKLDETEVIGNYNGSFATT